MALTPGTRLGPYEITAQLGAGGMGEVWRARDAKLDRDVAIKILPEAFAHDADRLARFQREAKTLASLNHPNIAAIYGLEESPAEAGHYVRALVMELVEGEDLSQRIARGAIPVDEALPIAKQIAEALEAAHEQGIIHRDLKPANIKVRADGTVKVLDFGLAKAMEPTGAMSPGVSQAPTITTPAHLRQGYGGQAVTGVGVILGTAAYMSPEQARGKPVDKRTDIWAFACVLYEMLTGRRAFDGEDVAETLARIIEHAPDFTVLPASLPAAVSRLLRRCLAKDRRNRLADIADARLELLEASGGGVPSRHPEAALRRWWQQPSVVAPWGAVLLLTPLAVWALTRPSVPLAPAAPARFALALPAGVTVSQRGIGVAVSPDGQQIVVAGSEDGVTRLYRRSIDQLNAVPIAGTEGAASPFFSPDSASIGFFTQDELKRVSLDGRPVQTVARIQAEGRGAAWTPADVIVFSDQSRGLWRVPAAGGAPERVMSLSADVNFDWIDVLPDGDTTLATAWRSREAVTTSQFAGEIAVVSLSTGETEFLFAGTTPRYAPSGHIVFWRGGSVWGVPFDAATRRATGPAVPVLEGVAMGITPNVAAGTGREIGPAQFAVGGDGSMVYLAGSTDARQMVWVEVDGGNVREQVLVAPAEPYGIPRIDPTGRRVVVQVENDEFDLWVYDLVRGTLERLTRDPGEDRDAAWSRDGARIAYYAAGREGGPGIFVRAADGTGTPERLTTGVYQLPMAWSAGDRELVFAHLQGGPVTNIVAPEGPAGQAASGELYLIGVGSPGLPQPLLASPAREDAARISPNGQWIAYETSEASGTGGETAQDVFVRPFPDVDRGWRISPDGGFDPVWSPEGRTLYYRRGETIMAVDVSDEPPSGWGQPVPLFAGSYVFSNGPTHFDVAPGGRFLMIRALAEESGGSRLRVVQHWVTELQRLAPRN